MAHFADFGSGAGGRGASRARRALRARVERPTWRGCWGRRGRECRRRGGEKYGARWQRTQWGSMRWRSIHDGRACVGVCGDLLGWRVDRPGARCNQTLSFFRKAGARPCAPPPLPRPALPSSPTIQHSPSSYTGDPRQRPLPAPSHPSILSIQHLILSITTQAPRFFHLFIPFLSSYPTFPVRQVPRFLPKSKPLGQGGSLLSIISRGARLTHSDCLRKSKHLIASFYPSTSKVVVSATYP